MGVCFSGKDSVLQVEENESIASNKESDSTVGSDCSSISDASDFDEELKADPLTREGSVVFEGSECVKKVSVEINGVNYLVEEGSTVYDASLKCLDDNMRIPTVCEIFLFVQYSHLSFNQLCHHPYLPCSRLYRGKCGICEVEDLDSKKMIRSCREIVSEGMRISTTSERVTENIRAIILKKLVNHVLECPNCPSRGRCMFEKLLQRYDVSYHHLDMEGKKKYLANQEELFMCENRDDILVSNESLVYNHSKCLTCYRCLRVCEYIQGMSSSSILSSFEEGFRKPGHAKPFKDLEDYHENMFSNDCIRCGMCSFVCPTAAITEKSCIDDIIRVIRTKKNERRVLVCQVAPSVRITIPEMYDKKPGTIDERTFVSCLKKIGFDYVFDTLLGADLCTVEESNELIERLHRGGPFPMFTSCCPAWINMAEKCFPEYLPNISTCKSPQAMMGAVIKKYWAGKMNIDSNRIILVSLMPCTAKKSEIVRRNIKGVDYVLTTRELGRMLKQFGIDLVGHKGKADFDSPLGDLKSSLSGLYGVTGGVIENVLNTATAFVNMKNAGYKWDIKNVSREGSSIVPSPKEEETEGEEDEVVTDVGSRNISAVGKYDKISPRRRDAIKKSVRGLKDYKTGVVTIGGQYRLKYAVINGGLNIKKFLGKLKYDEESSMGTKENLVVEFMTCPAGCIGGGGNPKMFSKMSWIRKRARATYNYSKLMNYHRRQQQQEEEILIERRNSRSGKNDVSSPRTRERKPSSKSTPRSRRKVSYSGVFPAHLSEEEEEDGEGKIRCAHENPEVKLLYKEFFKSPGSTLAKLHLHTEYTNKKVQVISDEEDEL